MFLSVVLLTVNSTPLWYCPPRTFPMFLGPISQGKEAFQSFTLPIRYGEARTYCQ